MKYAQKELFHYLTGEQYALICNKQQTRKFGKNLLIPPM